MQLRNVSSAWILPILYWALGALATGSSWAQNTGGTATPSVEAHIGVLLPLQSSSFAKHAEAVRLGILAAAALEAGAPRMRIYTTDDDPQQILSAYNRAVSLGARLIIGPLTRSGVTTLVYNGATSVPTIALNSPEGDVVLPRDFYVFGLQIEAETRQLANWAFRKGGNRVFLVIGESSLGTRIAQAFENEWKSLRGEVVGQFGYTTDMASLAKLREQIVASRADVIFTTLDAERTRFLRGFLGKSMPVYATSQVFAFANDAIGNIDLDGVRFLDMPWLLQPDHSAVMSYQRADPRPWAPDLERLFALGIDAYRIALGLLRPRQHMDSLDGVTGVITFGENRQFERQLVPAHYARGTARLLDSQDAQ